MDRYAVVSVHMGTGKASTVAVYQDADLAHSLADRHSSDFKTFVVGLTGSP